MADIDSLQIKIKADANNASNALNKLANSLTNFQKSLSIDTSKLTSISNSIQSIANAANSINTSGIKNISTLTNSINRMGKIDTSGLSKISSALKTFSADMAGTKVDGVGDIASIIYFKTWRCGIRQSNYEHSFTGKEFEAVIHHSVYRSECQ